MAPKINGKPRKTKRQNSTASAESSDSQISSSSSSLATKQQQQPEATSGNVKSAKLISDDITTLKSKTIQNGQLSSSSLLNNNNNLKLANEEKENQNQSQNLKEKEREKEKEKIKDKDKNKNKENNNDKQKLLLKDYQANQTPVVAAQIHKAESCIVVQAEKMQQLPIVLTNKSPSIAVANVAVVVDGGGGSASGAVNNCNNDNDDNNTIYDNNVIGGGANNINKQDNQNNKIVPNGINNGNKNNKNKMITTKSSSLSSSSTSSTSASPAPSYKSSCGGATSIIDPEEGVKIDTARVQRKFSSQLSQDEINSTCKICDKHVYQMERILAAKSIYHKQCFRCLQCKIQLRIDNYASHEGQIYCKAHHKQLFQPKPSFDADGNDEMANVLLVRSSAEPEIDEYLANRGPLSLLSHSFTNHQHQEKHNNHNNHNTQGLRRKQMIICENEPTALPDDVVRCNTKVDDGIDSLNLNLGNLRERFEQAASNNNERKQSSGAVDFPDIKPLVNIKQTLAAFDRQLSSESSDTLRSAATGSNQSPKIKRSESIMSKLKKYEAVMSGEKIVQSDESDESSNVGETKDGNNKKRGSEISAKTAQFINGTKSIDSTIAADLNNNINQDVVVGSVDLSSLKQQWEQGKVSKDNDDQRDKLNDERIEELNQVRESLASAANGRRNRNDSVKKIYEIAIQEANLQASKHVKSNDSIVLNLPTKANTLKEKFELGLTATNDQDGATSDNNEREMSRMEQLRQEKLEDLSIFQEGQVSAREARNMFKQIDRHLSAESNSQSNGLINGSNGTSLSSSLSGKNTLTNGAVTAAARRRFERQSTVASSNGVGASGLARSNTIAGDTRPIDDEIEIVKCSDPSSKENITVETTKLREKFNFFENYREQPRAPRRFEMTPPREIIANGRKYSTVTSDSSDSEIEDTATRNNTKSRRKETLNGNGEITKCSPTTRLDDLPKTDIARKMLDKFKQIQDGQIHQSSQDDDENGVDNSTKQNKLVELIPNINVNINAIKQTLLSPQQSNGHTQQASNGVNQHLSVNRPALKRITPPREYTLDNDQSSDDEDNNSHYQHNQTNNNNYDNEGKNIVRYNDKIRDEMPVEPEKARSLRMKFENWAQQSGNVGSLSDDEQENVFDKTQNKQNDDFVPQIDTTRNLKAKFEAFSEQNSRKSSVPRPQARQVNRFVSLGNGANDLNIQDYNAGLDTPISPIVTNQLNNGLSVSATTANVVE